MKHMDTWKISLFARPPPPNTSVNNMDIFVATNCSFSVNIHIFTINTTKFHKITLHGYVSKTLRKKWDGTVNAKKAAILIYRYLSSLLSLLLLKESLTFVAFYLSLTCWVSHFSSLPLTWERRQAGCSSGSTKPEAAECKVHWPARRQADQ